MAEGSSNTFKRRMNITKGKKIMVIYSEALVLTLLPYLQASEVKNYLATNKELYLQYDNDALWQKLASRCLNSKYRWVNHSKREIKKCIHFRKLTFTHTLPDLIDEITSTEQLNLLMTYINKSKFTTHAKNVLRIMIGVLRPQYLTVTGFFFPRYRAMPEHLKYLLWPMKKEPLHKLASIINEPEETFEGLRYSHYESEEVKHLWISF